MWDLGFSVKSVRLSAGFKGLDDLLLLDRDQIHRETLRCEELTFIYQLTSIQRSTRALMSVCVCVCVCESVCVCVSERERVCERVYVCV